MTLRSGPSPADHAESAAPIKRADKSLRAAAMLEWRLQGHTFPRIARELTEAGYAPLSLARISSIVKSEIRRAADPGGQRRDLELMRLDQLQAALYPKAMQGDGPATDRVLAIMDRRAKLLGLYSPRQEDETPEPANARQRLIEKLEAMAARMKGADT